MHVCVLLTLVGMWVHGYACMDTLMHASLIYENASAMVFAF